jgi:hypothetical protein
MSNSDDNLLQRPAGTGSSSGSPPSAQANVAETDAALQPLELEQLDHWRMLLVDLAYHLNGAFRDAHYWKGAKSSKDTPGEFIKILYELQHIPQNDGVVRIEHRGSPGAKIPEKSDYIIRFGGHRVDIAAVSALIKRIGIRVKHIEGRLIKSFEGFAARGMQTIHITIPDGSDEALEKMHLSMHIASCFSKAVEEDAPIEYVKNDQEFALKPILNEFDQPDPNLTQIAALNDLSPQHMQEMVQKVAALMKRANLERSGQQPANVYQAIFNIKSLRQRLDRPSIELNSEQGSQAEPDRKGAATGPAARGRGPGSVPGKMDPAVLKAKVAQFVKQAYGDSPEKAIQVMRTIYGRDCHTIDLVALEGRLQLITDLLTTLEGSDKGQALLENVLERIQTGMDQLPRAVLDELIFDGGEIQIWEEDQPKAIGKAGDNLLNIIDTAKDRSAARQKKRAAIRVDGKFGANDYELLSQTFEISIQEAEEIGRLLKSCFDNQGNFQRTLFEKNVPGFADHPRKIFEILWALLREIPRRSDRVPSLNSLQLLVKEIQQPMQAAKVLVSDFILDPRGVSFPDRNALMLVIQFLRTYNKEINMDIEITPEEVLMVHKGLDAGVARYLAWKIDGEHKRFVEKMATIRSKLIQSLEQAGGDVNVLPIRFLLALEREAHILLAIIGGQTATDVIQEALNAYGNPGSRIFLLKESPDFFTSLLQHLGILIRGIGRVGHAKDFALLDEIQKRQQGFMDLSAEPRHTALVRRTLGAIGAAKHEIGVRNGE